MESIDSYHGIDAKDLSLVPDLDSLTGAASKWYNQLSRTKIATWRDLALAFMRQYNHVLKMMPDRITLQNLEKKSNESFRQYAQRWREVAVQVQPPFLEKEMTTLYISTLKAPFFTHMLRSASKNFSDIIINGEMIEHAIKSGRIDGGEKNRRAVSKKRENEVNNVDTYSKSITVNQPRKVVANQQGSLRQESGAKQNTEKPQITPILMSYKELYQNLFNAHVVSPYYLNPLQPPYPKWYEIENYCEFHREVGHEIQKCEGFRALVQNMMDNKEVKFYEEVEDKGNICASESATKTPEMNHPVVIISRPKSNEARVQITPKIVIQKPSNFSYKDSRMVSWNYGCNVTIPRKEVERNQEMGSYTRNGKGRGSTKALHITTRCKGCTFPGVLVDNGSALNVLPLSTLNQLPVDSSHMKACQSIVRAFDGTERRVMGRIEVSLMIGPTTYEVDFLIMDIKPSYNCLLGRPWIHSVGAVPSSLHQKVKLVLEGRLITINAEEDIIAT
ncbi:uncharacterized protein LOC105763457 [Gossypium raimondii]|uniref:uncharacterized protein LOC105763457 n=1 Tax=Gossypium raimondii TaxID=29730 RepID=UPI00227AA306|nr:uncharacterized protein LOC105763457 [Gossypium raimondii]